MILFLVSLTGLDWSNVFAAGKLIYSMISCFMQKKKFKDHSFWLGGAVLSSLLPIPHEYNVNPRKIREWYHTIAYKSSDIDLFIYGLDEEAAKKKIAEIYEVVQNVIPYEVACFRSKHCITISSQYPYRHIQVCYIQKIKDYFSINEI